MEGSSSPSNPPLVEVVRTLLVIKFVTDHRSDFISSLVMWAMSPAWAGTAVTDVGGEEEIQGE